MTFIMKEIVTDIKCTNKASCLKNIITLALMQYL